MQTGGETSVEADWEASVTFLFCRGRKRCTLPEANIAPVNSGWETTFPLGGPIFRAYVSFREGNWYSYTCFFKKAMIRGSLVPYNGTMKCHKVFECQVATFGGKWLFFCHWAMFFFWGGKGLYLAMLELTCRRQTKKLGRIIDLLIWSPVAPVEGGWCEISNCLYLVIQSDLFGMVKWPFKGLSDLQLGDKKVTLNHLVDIYSIWCIGMSPPSRHASHQEDCETLVPTWQDAEHPGE